MTTFKITDKNHPLHGREFAEYTRFERYHIYSANVTWIPLLIGANTVKFFARCNLEAVREPFDSGMDYCYPQLCTTLAIWKPTIEVPITELGFWKPGSKGIPGVNLHMSNVRIVLTLPEAA